MGDESVGRLEDHLGGRSIKRVVGAGLVLMTNAKLEKYPQEMNASIRRKASPPMVIAVPGD